MLFQTKGNKKNIGNFFFCPPFFHNNSFVLFLELFKQNPLKTFNALTWKDFDVFVAVPKVSQIT